LTAGGVWAIDEDITGIGGLAFLGGGIPAAVAVGVVGNAGFTEITGIESVTDVGCERKAEESERKHENFLYGLVIGVIRWEMRVRVLSSSPEGFVPSPRIPPS
jgi:hypothetical protein